uniref:hypothetical protein n=1 Tax=Ralstonia pseudosolanacearum TaxID=1310165 RepID=UPI00322155AE
MADHDPSTQPPAEPSGSAEARLAALQTLENGEATKQSQMKWVDGANYGMLGADVGYGVYAQRARVSCARTCASVSVPPCGS